MNTAKENVVDAVDVAGALIIYKEFIGNIYEKTLVAAFAQKACD